MSAQFIGAQDFYLSLPINDFNKTAILYIQK